MRGNHLANAANQSKDEKEKIVENKMGGQGQQKSISPVLKTRQSHTIEYRVTKNNPPKILRGDKSPGAGCTKANGDRIHHDGCSG